MRVHLRHEPAEERGSVGGWHASQLKRAVQLRAPGHLATRPYLGSQCAVAHGGDPLGDVGVERSDSQDQRAARVAPRP